MFNGRIYFIGALYHIRGAFGHLQEFLEYTGDSFNALPYDRDAVLNNVERVRNDFLTTDGIIGKEEALKAVIAEDLGRIKTVLADDAVASELDRRKSIDDVLLSCRDNAIRLLADIGIEMEPPAIFVVDKLPKPFDDMPWIALNADAEDRDRHGVEPGLYFIKDRLRPFYSEFLLTHELIHTVIGQRTPHLFARGLEEGLAEVVGAMYLSSRLLGRDLTANLFIYNRLSYSYDQFWELYLDATRQATYLYNRFGLDGLARMIDEGRVLIKDVEECCLRMQFDRIKLPSGKWSEDLDYLANYLALTFPRNLVVSPAAKYLSRFIRPGKTVAEIVSEARIDATIGKDAIKELQDRINLIYLRGDDVVVSSSDSCRHQDETLRYAIPKDA